MTKSIDEIKQFLEEHNYLVKVYGLDDYSCKVIFPSSDSQKPEEITYKYSSGNLTIGDINIPLLEDSYRLGIYLEILNKMKKNGIHPSLITYYKSDGEKVSKLTELLKPPENIKKEMELAKIAAAVINKKEIL